MTRGDIGNYLGLTVETISRLLGRFQKSGMLAVKGKYITIENSDLLAQLAGQGAQRRLISAHHLVTIGNFLRFVDLTRLLPVSIHPYRLSFLVTDGSCSCKETLYGEVSEHAGSNRS